MLPFTYLLFPNQKKLLFVMTRFFAWLSFNWLRGIITTLTEGDQCWALIKVTTGVPRNLPLPVFDPH